MSSQPAGGVALSKQAISLAVIVMCWTHAWSHAQVPLIFRDGDLTLGRQLISEHRCAACHQQKVGGDGSSMYRPQGRIVSPGALRGMVEQCNLTLNLSLFPDEVTAIAAALNHDYYRFK